MQLIDAHCHLDVLAKGSLELAKAILERAKEAGVAHTVAIGQWRREGDFGGTLELLEAFPSELTATMGIHPHEVGKVLEKDWGEWERLCMLEGVHAIGETGLDYYYKHSGPEQQREAFRRHCQLAKRLGKPLVVHMREAHEDCIHILREEGVGEQSVIHCFSGDVWQAEAYLKLGCCLSISGIVTYVSAEALREAVKSIPDERLLLETDSPYLAPVPMRGKQNEPAFVVHTAKAVAKIRKTEVELLAQLCSANTLRFLGRGV
ncbi:MAG: TatD family hydrolase [Proteobacteria bacterium]|nr:TatD family hydrolase [Cystobacterineae bacterium]MCL2259577.1 TatD family hydrolase [Cystobacterineae bacterium]MCL2313940.1 TatD family hydrolase [Pseudomonadota bacterium]